jgi:hypothetical protein
MKTLVRMIHLPALDRYVTLSSYIAAIKIAKANPTVTYKHGLTCWWPCTGAEVMEQFRAGLMDRINQAIPYCERGMHL